LRLDGKAAAFGVSTNFALVLDVKEKGGYVVIAPGEMKFSSLSFIPKMIIVGIVLVLAGPWMMDLLSNYTTQLFQNISEIVRE
jgi:hypothetical protein